MSVGGIYLYPFLLTCVVYWTLFLLRAILCFFLFTFLLVLFGYIDIFIFCVPSCVRDW